MPQLVSPSVASEARTVPAPCPFCGPGGCNVPMQYQATYTLEGAAVRVTSRNGAIAASTLVPFDAPGIGQATSMDPNVSSGQVHFSVGVYGTSLAAAITVSGHSCDGVIIR